MENNGVLEVHALCSRRRSISAINDKRIGRHLTMSHFKRILEIPPEPDHVINGFLALYPIRHVLDIVWPYFFVIPPKFCHEVPIPSPGYIRVLGNPVVRRHLLAELAIPHDATVVGLRAF